MGIEVEYQFRRIDEWPGELTPARDRKRSPFDSTYTATLNLLTRELGHIIERKYGTAGPVTGPVIFGLAVDDSQITVDRSRPKANARPEHPGILVAFKSKHGPLRYATDVFTTWQDNLRAVALGLEALRKVDRYGISKGGQQYRGFAALGSGTDGPTSVEEAFETVRKVSGTAWTWEGYQRATPHGRAAFHREAQRRSHPDTGGNEALFIRVQTAIDFLRENVR